MRYLDVRNISKNIEQISICCQYDIVEIQSSIKLFTSFTYKEVVEDNQLYSSPINCGKIQQQKQLTLQFHIHSLIIKYKKDKEILYYPSLNSVKFQEKHSLIWNPDKKLIKLFKDFSDDTRFSSPMFGNVFIDCYPNGWSSDTKGVCLY